LQPIIPVQFRLNFPKHFTGHERERSCAGLRAINSEMTMKPVLTLLCIGAATFIASAASASTPTMPELSEPATLVNRPLPKPAEFGTTGSTGEVRMAAMNAYLWAKGQKSGGIKKRR
jgi:hypothetical protein